MEWFYINDRLKEKFLSYDARIRYVITRKIESIIEFPSEREMYASKETHNIFKLKSSACGLHVRVFFTYYDGDIVLLHIFTKKTKKTPKKELQQARRSYNLLYEV